MANLTNVIYLSAAQYQVIANGGSVDGYTYDPNAVYLVPQDDIGTHIYKHDVSFSVVSDDDENNYRFSVLSKTSSAANTKDAIRQIVSSAINANHGSVFVEVFDADNVLTIEVLDADEETIYTWAQGSSEYGTLEGEEQLLLIVDTVTQII